MLKAIKQSTQKVLQKIGNSEKSVDETFEEQRQKWEKMTKLIAAIEKDLKKQRKLEGIYFNFLLFISLCILIF